MAVQKIRLFGDPVLKTKTHEVRDFDKSLRHLVDDLTDTMADAHGYGLAAPQIGVQLRVFTFIVKDDDDNVTSHHLVNPVIAETSEETEEVEEGCLSLPGLWYPLRRAWRVVATGFDMHGEPERVVGDGMLARCLQHETDHLDGVLFLDKLDPETRREAMKAIRAAPWFDPAAPPTVK